VQNLFHLADRRGTPVLEECLRRGIAFVPFCPLGWPRGRDNPVLTSPVVIRTAAHLRENMAAEGVTLDPQARRELDGVAA
jgi:pyridoxine 4-dehydrogenase